jgi:hypothetical protein
MDMPEGFGPISMSAGLRVPYTKEEGPLLSQESALSIARSEIARSRAGIEPTQIPHDVGIVDDKAVSSSLAIVEAFPKAPWWQWGAKPKRTARLAWQIWFVPIYAAAVAGPTYDHHFVISVDVHTGEVIGVVAML